MSKYLALDLETSGLDPATSDILELAAVPLDERLEPVGKGFEMLVRPAREVSTKACEINGHWWAIEQKGEEWENAHQPVHAWEWFHGWLTKQFHKPEWIVLVGWNVGFDQRHLRELYDRVAECGTKWPFHYHIVDLIGVYLEAVMDSYDGPMTPHPGENAAKKLYCDIRAWFEERGEFAPGNPDRYR